MKIKIIKKEYMGKILKFSCKERRALWAADYEIQITILQNDFKDEDALQHRYFVEDFKIYLKSNRKSDCLCNLTKFKLKRYLIFLHNFKIEDHLPIR